MHRIAALVLAASTALPASAAVVYDFRQVNRSDAINAQPIEVVGKGIIDGDRSRVEFVSGNLYPKGSYIISRRGAREVTLVNPEKRTFARFETSALTNQLTSADIQITNLKTKVDLLPDHPMISGFPTDHYRIETSYQISWSPGSLRMTQNVTTVIEKWTTSAFGDVAGGYIDESPFKTGNAQIDAVLAAETAKVKGLPLRQITSTTTTAARNVSRSGSQLPTRSSRTQHAEILLSNVRIESVPDAMFEVPRGFRPVDGKRDDSSKMHILSLEPETP